MSDEEDKELETPLFSPPASTPTPVSRITSAPGVGAAQVAGVPPGLAARYDVLAEVGHGGMGVVYRARDRETEETVALKVLKTEIAARPDYIERFKSELRLARKITHKNVCRTHELLRFDDTVAIAMEFVEGESLREVLKRFGGVPLRRGIEWLRQMCSALGEAHAQGIVHRDLKPENLVVDREGQVRIMDFGIAHSLESDKLEAGLVIGTPAYMSPEQAEGKPLDGRSDIYALGLIAYEMFTGRQAFGGGTAVTQLKKRLSEPPPAPRSVEPYLPAFLERVILKCLEQDPARRYASVAELERVLAGSDETPDEDVPLPARLQQPSLLDVGLLAAGALGVAAFLSSASFLYPESLVRLRLTRAMLAERARAELQSRGFQPPGAPTFQGQGATGSYELLSRRSGNETARRRLADDLPNFFIQVRYPKAESPRDVGAFVSYAPNGELRALDIPVVGFVPAGSAGLTRDAALQLAEEELRKAYGAEARAAALEQEGTLSEGTRRGHSFRWIALDPSGVSKQYFMNVFDRVTHLRKEHKLAEDFQRRRSNSLAPTVLSLWFAATLLLFFWNRVFARLERKETISLALLGLVVGLVTVNNANDIAIQLLIGGSLFLGWVVTTSSTVCFLAQRPWPHLVASYLALVRMRPRAVATGLAVARGAALGLLILGLRALLVRAGAAFDWTWPQANARLSFVGAPFPAGTFLGETLLGALGLTFMLGFVLSLARRLTANTLLLMSLGGASWTLFEFGSLPVDFYAAGVTFVVTAAFALVLLRFDLLTLLAAALSADLWASGWTLLQIFELIGNPSVTLFLSLWGAAVAAAIFYGFRSLLQRAGGPAAQLVG